MNTLFKNLAIISSLSTSIFLSSNSMAQQSPAVMPSVTFGNPAQTAKVDDNKAELAATNFAKNPKPNCEFDGVINDNQFYCFKGHKLEIISNKVKTDGFSNIVAKLDSNKCVVINAKYNNVGMTSFNKNSKISLPDVIKKVELFENCDL